MAASVASWAETSLLCAELCREGTRLVEWNGSLPWAQPVDSPLRDGRLRELLAHATALAALADGSGARLIERWVAASNA